MSNIIEYRARGYDIKLSIEQLEALARVLNHVEERFTVEPKQLESDIKTLHQLWMDNTHIVFATRYLD